MNALPEYECHRESREAGLNCLRDQLTGDIQDEVVSQKPCSIFTGDELLTWTIETFRESDHDKKYDRYDSISKI